MSPEILEIVTKKANDLILWKNRVYGNCIVLNVASAMFYTDLNVSLKFRNYLIRHNKTELKLDQEMSKYFLSCCVVSKVREFSQKDVRGDLEDRGNFDFELL